MEAQGWRDSVGRDQGHMVTMEEDVHKGRCLAVTMVYKF